MKKILVLLSSALLYVGCDRSNPIDSSVAATDVPFSEQSMVDAAVTSNVSPIQLQSDTYLHDSLHHPKRHPKDSLRFVRMLDSLKARVGLSDAQFENVKVYGKILSDSLKSIRAQFHSRLITRFQVQAKIQAARGQFVNSVLAILTTEQQTLFKVWIKKFWNIHHNGFGHGPGGMGGGH